jgi:hypothetical protein
MKKYLLGLLVALACISASAEDFIYTEGKNSVTAFGSIACQSDIRAKIKPEHQSKFRAGKVTIDGKEYRACWIELNGQVFVVDEDGDSFEIPSHQFRKLREV